MNVAMRYTKKQYHALHDFSIKECVETVTNNVGKKLQELRKARKLTQQQLAEKMGVTRATVSNYEVGRRAPHLSELKRFAEFYGVGLDYFGVASTDEIFDLLSRAKAVFENDSISKDAKDELHLALMRFYLSIKHK